MRTSSCVEQTAMEETREDHLGPRKHREAMHKSLYLYREMHSFFFLMSCDSLTVSLVHLPKRV